MTLTPRTDAILADDTGDSSLIRNLATLARTLERELNAAKAKSELCQCSLATRLVGDGCERCNPEKAQEIKEQNYEDRISDLERDITELNERLIDRTQGMLAKQVEMLNEIRRLNRILGIKDRSKQNPYAGL
jgi:hypothetical protein